MDEFNDAEEVVRGLVEEYAAAEKQDYIEWGEEKDGADGDDRMNYQWYIKSTIISFFILLFINIFIILLKKYFIY